jgi:hypothetical protein
MKNFLHVIVVAILFSNINMQGMELPKNTHNSSDPKIAFKLFNPDNNNNLATELDKQLLTNSESLKKQHNNNNDSDLIMGDVSDGVIELKDSKGNLKKTITLPSFNQNLHAKSSNGAMICWSFETYGTYMIKIEQTGYRRIILYNKKPVHTLAFSPDNQYLFIGSDKSASIWDTNEVNHQLTADLTFPSASSNLAFTKAIWGIGSLELRDKDNNLYKAESSSIQALIEQKNNTK